MTREQHQAYIRGLLEERSKLEARARGGDTERATVEYLESRISQINEQLGEVAQEAKLPQKRAEKRPAAVEATER